MTSWYGAIPLSLLKDHGVVSAAKSIKTSWCWSWCTPRSIGTISLSGIEIFRTLLNDCDFSSDSRIEFCDVTKSLQRSTLSSDV